MLFIWWDKEFSLVKILQNKVENIMTMEKLYSEGQTIVPLSQYTDVITPFDTTFSAVKTCVFNFHVHRDTSVTIAVYFY